MLHEALLVANRRDQEEKAKLANADLLKQLPLEVLKEIAETGTLKLAYGMCSPDGSSNGSWVDQFKGTPFFQQAIALEQEDLQQQTAQQQSSAVQRQKMDQEYAQQDQVRLKKKLLELQKARNEAQVLDGGAGPPAAAGSPDPAGTAPGSPAGPLMEELKTAAQKKFALSAATLGSYAKKQTDVAGLASASKSLMGRGSQLVAGGNAAAGVKKVNQGNFLAQKATALAPAAPAMSKAASVVDGWAREMARDDMAKVAHARETFSIGDSAGRMMAKTALAAGAGSKILDWAIKNPGKAGAIVGGVGGAVGGAANDGISGAVKGGLAGAGVGAMAGHTIGGVHSHMKSGRELGDAVKAHGETLLAKARKPVDDLKKGWEEGAKPATPVG